LFISRLKSINVFYSSCKYLLSISLRVLSPVWFAQEIAYALTPSPSTDPPLLDAVGQRSPASAPLCHGCGW